MVLPYRESKKLGLLGQQRGTSGGKTRQYHLLRSLAARGHRITVLLHSKQPVSAEDRRALEPFLERLVVLPRRPLRSLSTLLAALFAPYPLLASVNGLSAELQRTATELLREPWDVVQVEHSYSFQPYERPLRDAGQPFVLTEHNVESSLGAATYDRLPGWALPFVRYDQWRYRRWERRVMSQAAAVVAVTEKDARQLGAMLGRPVPVVVNGVDCEHFAAARPTPEAQRVLFLGNYEYAPNVDAVEWMLDEILPRVWAHCPEARMSVCGYALPADWAQRWSDPRIEWQGFVPDLLQLQSSSSVFLAALRHGGGSKLKVLEALAAGLPLASTAQGVSGLELRDGEDYLGGETAEQLANAVVRLLQDPAQARSLGENGRAYVRRAHDWSVAASQLEQVYAGLAEGAPACA
ncbi:TPA: glycosyltransferase family 4 protein [Pseudomonas aeruginosa]